MTLYLGYFVSLEKNYKKNSSDVKMALTECNDISYTTYYHYHHQTFSSSRHAYHIFM